MAGERETRMLQSWVRRAMRPLAARVNSMINRAVVSLVDDTKLAQLVQLRVMRNEVFDEVEHAQQAGVSFVPVKGAEAILLGVGGSSNYPIAICMQKRGDRPSDVGVAEGEGGLYYAGEYKVFVKSDGTVHLGAKEASEEVAVASKVDAEFQRIWDLLTGWAVSPNDGGGALQTQALTDSTLVQPVGSATVKCTE